MKKLQKLLLAFTICLSVLAGLIASCSWLFPSSSQTNKQSEEFIKIEKDPSITASTSLATSASDIFTEIKNDGVVSYLKISIPLTPSSLTIKSIIIRQTIGNTSYTLTQDELGTDCYYVDKLNTSKNTVFYFTRPAIYTVYYDTTILGTTTSYSETCTFKPELNHNIIEQITTSSDGGVTENSIKVANGNYFIINSGETTIPLDSLGLYKNTALAKDTKTDSLLTNIPDNSYGTVNYVIQSTQEHTYLILPITVLTVKFDTSFYDANDVALSHADHFFMSTGYVFNESVKLNSTVNSSAVDLRGTTLTQDEKLELLNHLEFGLMVAERDEQNASTRSSVYTAINYGESFDGVVKENIPESDHTLYTLMTYLKNEDSNILYNNRVCEFKVITKVPVNESGNYIFSAIPGQLSYSDTNNYIKGVLNGYLRKGVHIQNSLSTVTIYNNGYSGKNDPLIYTYNGVDKTIIKSNLQEFTTDTTDLQAQIINNGDIIQLKNSPDSFANLFVFNVKIYTYNTGYDFRGQMIDGQMFYDEDDSAHAIKISPDHNKDLLKDVGEISKFIYKVPTGYQANGIPVQIRVTFNGSSFDNIYTLSDGDVLEFSDYGQYEIEFYTIPSYDFVVQNLTALGPTLYYYKITFTVTGPSIYATTTNTAGDTITVSNNLFTQSPVNVDVKLGEEQKFVVYLNNDLYTEKTESMDFSISDVGAWRVSIYTNDGTLLNELNVTIMDNIYQGFSMNFKDEYEKLVMYKLNAETPPVFEALPNTQAYHLTESGTYRLEMQTRESLNFAANGHGTIAYTLNANTFDFKIAKSHFTLNFIGTKNGGRTPDAIIIGEVDGVRLQSLEVYRNGELEHTFTAEELAEWETVSEGARSFKDNGTYTFKLTDTFGNSYEAQVEKYYKVNFALILLILLAIGMIIALFIIIFKARHNVKVK